MVFELAKSMMLGDEAGMLKLLFDPETHKLLGVHALGQRATEIIHIGQAVLFYGGAGEYFRGTVFHYPTPAQGYKIAALNRLNKVSQLTVCHSSGLGLDAPHRHQPFE